jgi:hypothetical protein
MPREVSFQWDAYKAGIGPGQLKKTVNGTVNDNNVAGNSRASFHTIGLSIIEPRGLKARVGCTFINAAEQLVEGPWVEDGGQSPPGGVANSRYIQAIRIDLDGEEKRNYKVSYTVKTVKVHRDRPKFQESGETFSASDGGWAGYLNTEPLFFLWIYEISISIQ